MRALERRETGRTKGAREHVSDPSWKRAERADARWLTEHDGPETDPTMARLLTSTGRCGQLSSLGFDISSATYVGEAKERKKFPAWLVDAWTQLFQIATERGKEQVMFLHLKGAEDWVPVGPKKMRLPDPIHCITAARHADLLAKERRLAELEGRCESTGDT